jgi:hypothetical protein
MAIVAVPTITATNDIEILIFSINRRGLKVVVTNVVALSRQHYI